MILRPTKARETLLKAKYIKRWKGPDGKWRYEYPKPKTEGKKTSSKKTEKPKSSTRNYEKEIFQGLGKNAKMVHGKKPEVLLVGPDALYKVPEDKVLGVFKMKGHTFAITPSLKRGDKLAPVEGLQRKFTVTELSSGAQLLGGYDPGQVAELAYNTLNRVPKAKLDASIERAMPMRDKLEDNVKDIVE